MAAVTVRNFILGLLAQQSMSGYDIKHFLKGLGWLIDSPSFGSIYPTLRALLEDDLVAVKVFPRADKPPRKIYRITEPGKQVLQEWINQPATEDASLKTFVMRLMLAGSLSQAGLIAHLEQRHSQISVNHTALEEMCKRLDEEKNPGRRLALEYGLAIAAAESTWLQGMLAQFSEGLLPVEGVQDDNA